jgi:hypothetical protein
MSLWLNLWRRSRIKTIKAKKFSHPGSSGLCLLHGLSEKVFESEIKKYDGEIVRSIPLLEKDTDFYKNRR